MATSNFRLLASALLIMSASAARAHEEAPPAACQAAAEQPPIADARAALDRKPYGPRAFIRLADAWSDAGCFNAALAVLERARALYPDDKELDTHLRVARSVIGEEHFFDQLDRADVTARQKRAAFRCTTLADAAACAAANLPPVKDPAAPAESPQTGSVQPPSVPTATTATTTTTPSTPGSAPNLAPQPPPTPVPVAPTVRLARATAGAEPPRRYSNAAPESQSH